MKIPSKVINRDILRDGGTIVLSTDTGKFFIDKRIGTQTKNAVYYFLNENDPSTKTFAPPHTTRVVHELNKQQEEK